MTLYHGTNSDIESIDLAKGIRYKDFGQGFYLTPNRQTAVRMAQKKAKLFGGTPEPITPPGFGHSMLFKRFDGQWMMSVHHHSKDVRGRTVRIPHFFEVDLSGDKLKVIIPNT